MGQNDDTRGKSNFINPMDFAIFLAMEICGLHAQFSNIFSMGFRHESIYFQNPLGLNHP